MIALALVAFRSVGKRGSVPPMIGRVLGGKYRIERLLGEGGMGAVYEAVNTAIGKRVAVKYGDGEGQSVWGATSDAAGNLILVAELAGALDFGNGALNATVANGPDLAIAKLAR